MKLDPTDDRHRTAVHEAGHAVSEFILTGIAPVVVSIVANDAHGTLGSTHSLYGPDGRSTTDYETFIVNCFAGHAAWSRFVDGSIDESVGGNEDDEAQAARMLEFLAGDPVENGRRLRERARNLVETNWRAVKRVARELLEFEALDSNETEFMIEIELGRIEESELARYRELFGMNFPGKSRALLKASR